MNTLVTCACCGVSLDREEAEIALDWQGDECFECHRCFNEECDCNDTEIDNCLPPYEEPTGEAPTMEDLMFAEYEDEEEVDW